MAYRLTSHYLPYSPHYPPAERPWPDTYPDYPSAWAALTDYLIGACQWAALNENNRILAAYGQTQPGARFGETVVRNDAETIRMEYVSG